MKIFKFLLFFACFLSINLTVLAQNSNFLSGKDLSTIKVEALTDVEIGIIQAELKKAGVSIED